MKHLLLICLFVGATGAQAANQYREFTSRDGKTIRGCITAYDATREVVSIERDNRRTATVPISVFSETDQAYIRDWEIMRCFETDRFFKISGKRKKGEDKTEGYQSSYFEKDVEITSYEISLDNRASFNFEGLQLEYCIYYEQEKLQGGKEICDQGVCYGKLPVQTLFSRSQQVIQTDGVAVYTEELSSDAIYVNGMDNVQSGDVHGVWIRIHLKLPSGQEGMREYCLPDSLNNSKAWMTSSIRAGMN